MKALGVILLAAAAVLFAFWFFDFDVQRTGSLPEIQVEGGQMPEVDVKPGDIEVREKVVTIPTVEVDPAREGAEGKAE